MKNNRIAVCFILIFILFLLASCSSDSKVSNVIGEMKLTENYDSSDPFIDERLFFVSDNIDTLKLDISFQMEGESGLLEIADNDSKEILWSDSWNENTDQTTYSISLNDLDKEKEYVIRFTGTKIQNAKITITSNSMAQGREQSQNSNKD